MKQSLLTVSYNTLKKPVGSEDSCVITVDELREWVMTGTIIKRLFRYNEVKFLTYNLDYIPRLFALSIVLRLLTTTKCFFQDDKSNIQIINLRYLSKRFLFFVADLFRKPLELLRVNHTLKLLENLHTRYPIQNLDLSATPVYIRSDLWFGISSGGSIGHISGVLNSFSVFTGKPVFLTTDVIPTVRNDVETHYIYPSNRFWDFEELPYLSFNAALEKASHDILQNRKLAFIYQRYSLFNYTGLKLAKQYQMPFVLEYNGSEIWVARNWGKPLKYEALAGRIEILNLTAADVIVVVSDPLRAELINRGIDRDKILVNPNGVDIERYKPEINGSGIREKLGLTHQIVLGFIGTFGKWHGAEVLAEAFGRLLAEYPPYRNSVRLLLIGDGMTMPSVKAALKKYNAADSCILTGRIPQEQGPEHLAACDILASPHVPNPDGTPFFGSPTKLFEYMAMGKGIVASDLDQIGEILKHEKTAWMVKPGDADSLMSGLKKLIDDRPLRERLGKAAREEVVANYTWKEHTRKIIKKLQEVMTKRNQT